MTTGNPSRDSSRNKVVPIPQVPPRTAFLDQLASQLKIGRHAAYRRAVQRILNVVKKNYESGKYSNTTEAEFAFRKLLDQEENRE